MAPLDLKELKALMVEVERVIPSLTSAITAINSGMLGLLRQIHRADPQHYHFTVGQDGPCMFCEEDADAVV
jgi:hypothetical protein